MRCIHLVWTKYYVTDCLGVKMHGLPLVYIYICTWQLFSSTLCGLVALRHAVCPSFSKVLRRNTMNLTTHAAVPVLFIKWDFSCWQTLVWMQHRHCILMLNLWFKINFATDFCWKLFCLKLNLPQIFDLHFLPHTVAQIDDYCSLSKQSKLMIRLQIGATKIKTPEKDHIKISRITLFLTYQQNPVEETPLAPLPCRNNVYLPSANISTATRWTRKHDYTC